MTFCSAVPGDDPELPYERRVLETFLKAHDLEAVMDRPDWQEDVVIFTTWDALDGPTEWDEDRAREADYEAWLVAHPEEPYPARATYDAWLAEWRKAEFARRVAADRDRGFRSAFDHPTGATSAGGAVRKWSTKDGLQRAVNGFEPRYPAQK